MKPESFEIFCHSQSDHGRVVKQIDSYEFAEFALEWIKKIWTSQGPASSRCTGQSSDTADGIQMNLGNVSTDQQLTLADLPLQGWATVFRQEGFQGLIDSCPLRAGRADNRSLE